MGFLDAMPLTDPGTIRTAWQMVWHPVITAAVRLEPGELEQARDRIQFAAVEHGLGPLPYPVPRQRDYGI